MDEIIYIKSTHDSAVGRIRTVTSDVARVLVALNYVEYHQKKIKRRRHAKKDKGAGNV